MFALDIPVQRILSWGGWASEQSMRPYVRDRVWLTAGPAHVKCFGWMKAVGAQTLQTQHAGKESSRQHRGIPYAQVIAGNMKGSRANTSARPVQKKGKLREKSKEVLLGKQKEATAKADEQREQRAVRAKHVRAEHV